MTKYNVSPLVAREIEFSTGTIFGGSWCRYFISITLHQCYIEATWKTRPKNDLDGHKEIFNSLQEYLDWFANLKKTYGRRISRKQMVYAAYDETTRTFTPEHIRLQIRDILQIPLTDITIIDIISLP